MTRFLDLIIASVGLVAGSPLIVIIMIVGFFDTRSPIFLQQRVGKSQKPFILIKFRTMRVGTASVPSHLADTTSVTRFGAFLRRTKLDELPQLVNVIMGDMSLVGPRPGLYNQSELLEARQRYGVFDVRPGITGLAQIRGVDMSTPEELAKMDASMVSTLTIYTYLSYIVQTAFGAGSGDALR